MLLPCSAVPYSGVVRSSTTLISGDGVNILLFFFHHLFVFTVFKKLMLAEKQKPAGLFFHANKQDTCVFLSKSWTIFWEKNVWYAHCVMLPFFPLKELFLQWNGIDPWFEASYWTSPQLGNNWKSKQIYEFYREAVFLALFPDSSFEVLISL